MKIEYAIIGVNILIFLVAPYLPNVVYTHFVETYVGITLLLIAALYCVSYGYLTSVSAFIGIASLYAESHARKARNVKGFVKATNTNEFESMIQPAPDLVPNEIHPDIEPAESEVIKSVPDGDDGDNTFKPVDTSINEKTNLPTVSNTKDAEDIYLKDNLAESELKE
jgi:hypothetical protein